MQPLGDSRRLRRSVKTRIETEKNPFRYPFLQWVAGSFIGFSRDRVMDLLRKQRVRCEATFFSIWQLRYSQIFSQSFLSLAGFVCDVTATSRLLLSTCWRLCTCMALAWHCMHFLASKNFLRALARQSSAVEFLFCRWWRERRSRRLAPRRGPGDELSRSAKVLRYALRSCQIPN